MKIIKKITAILLIILIFGGNIIYKTSYAAVTLNTNKSTNPVWLLKVMASGMVHDEIKNNTLDITTCNNKICKKIEGDLSDNEVDAKDAGILLGLLRKLIYGTSDNHTSFLNSCKTTLGNDIDDIELYVQGKDGKTRVGKLNGQSLLQYMGASYDTYYKKTWNKEGVTLRTVFNLVENDNTKNLMLKGAQAENLGNEDGTDMYTNAFCTGLCEDANGNVTDNLNGIFKIKVIEKGGKAWDFAFGYEGDSASFNGYLISEADKPTPTPTTPTPAKDTEFKTKLDYSAKIDGKDVGGSTNKDNYYVPNYIDPNKDKEGSKKDADVTATITVTSANDTIAKINNEVPGESSAKPNKLGWYYTDSTKTKISKLYPFKDYKEKNGVADLTEYTITGSDNNTSKQNVGVKWKFRIIDVSYNPANPKPSDKSVTVTITTNLPIDEKKLPKDWQINPNNNCQITKTFLRNDGDISEAVTVVKKGGDESDSTNIKITWPAEEQFDTKLDYSANIDGKEVGGELKGGVYYPKYDESNPKKDADVIATITTTTDGATIEKINDKDIGESKDNPNEDGWYYTNANDKTAVSKVYPFDKYNNSKDNGIVEEVAISKKGSSEKISTQKVSVKWPFRIIDHTTKDNGDGSITETITTNLPMDPDKVPEGWTMVPGTDNHQITRTKTKNDGNIDEIVDVYQNGTGDKASTESKYTWPEENKSVEEIKPSQENKQQKIVLPQTGESYVIAIFILLAVGMAVISRKKSRRNK